MEENGKIDTDRHAPQRPRVLGSPDQTAPAGPSLQAPPAASYSTQPLPLAPALACQEAPRDAPPGECRRLLGLL